jgi:hypothetical protein
MLYNVKTISDSEEQKYGIIIDSYDNIDSYDEVRTFKIVKVATKHKLHHTSKLYAHKLYHTSKPYAGPFILFPHWCFKGKYYYLNGSQIRILKKYVIHLKLFR